MTACASPPEFKVEKSRWVECYNLCGKKDRLDAVGEKDCICKDGRRISVQGPASANDEAGKLTKDTPNLFDFLLP
jgi:hypothetical protein